MSGNTWSVIHDLACERRSRIQAYGGLSSAAGEYGLGQGHVLSPLYFNLLINGAAAAIKRACHGVALGPGAEAPRVTVLM